VNDDKNGVAIGPGIAIVAISSIFTIFASIALGLALLGSGFDPATCSLAACAHLLSILVLLLPRP